MSLIPPHGGYRKLASYQSATIAYDLTVAFCDRYMSYKTNKSYRTYDQMVQAARSGKQNIAEASQASGTSKKTELKLLGVARASFEELLQDYEDFLRQHQLLLWDKNHSNAQQVRALAYKSNRSYTTYTSYLTHPESAANLLLTLIHQTNFLLDRQIKALEQDFLEQGGFTERLYRARRQARLRSYLLLFLLLAALLTPLAVFTLRSPEPTGSYLNPLPRGSEAVLRGQSLAFYLSTSRSFLDEARQLANSNPAQTPADKEKIVALLNQALSSANQAVVAYPKDPRSYQQRAEILLSVSHFNPAAKNLAEQDLATAQSLAGGQTPLLPQINPLDTLPIEQASLIQNVIVANPSDSSNSSDSSDSSSNVTKGTAILPAGQNELKIENWNLKIDSVIYLIPQGNTLNHPVYVKSKASASFVIAIDQPLPTDLTIDYWIINK